MFFERRIKNRISTALLQNPVVLLLGPRQVGKTTLVRQLAEELSMKYVSFDDIRLLSSVQQDPIGFLEQQGQPVIFDEIQRVPELFLPIKQIVDSNRKPGMYMLTGSANPLLSPKIADSLAGRMHIEYLWPLSQGEIRNLPELFLDTIFQTELHLQTHSSLSRDQLIESLIRGGYPLMQLFETELQVDDWLSSYLTTLLQRDVQDLAHIEGLSTLPNLLKLLATRPTSQLNSSELSRSSGLPSTTLNRYLVLLEALFLIYRLPAWSGNLSKRLIKAPKMYFTDSIIAYLLNLNIQGLKNHGELIGQLLENFVISELLKQIVRYSKRLQAYYFRTQSGAEVDIVLEDKQGRIVGIEIKASQTIRADDFKGLKEFAECTGNNFLRGIVLYTGNDIIPFGQNFVAMPLYSLWT